MPNAGAVLGMFLCFLAVGILIGTLIGAVILRAACALYNAMAGGKGSPYRVPEPELGKAMGIVLVTALINIAASFVLGLAVGGGAAATGTGVEGPALLLQLVSLPLSLLVMAAMLTAMLPTTFGRGILVALCNLLITILVVVAVGVIVGGVYLLLFLSARG
jgi:hypothetical protein